MPKQMMMRAATISARKKLREYGATGAIFHSDRSCKPYSIGQIDLKVRLSSEEGSRSADHVS